MKVATVDSVKIDTISASAIAEEQKNCLDVANCKQGKHPTSLTFEDVVIDDVTLFSHRPKKEFNG